MNRRDRPYYNLLLSFYYAFCGIAHALRHERNLRIDFAVGAYMLYFSRYYDFTRREYALLILTAGFVIVCELLNTAVENTVDLKTPVYNAVAKIAKDVAAGAVLVSAGTSIAVGCLLFWEPSVLRLIREDILRRATLWALLFAATLIFIFLPAPPFRKKDGSIKEKQS